MNRSIMYSVLVSTNVIYLILYGGVTMLSLLACVYLLLRRSNAFAPDITPPLRLRRWTAFFFACIVMVHLWYLPLAFLTSSEDIKLGYYFGAILDFLVFFPLAMVVMIVMLQDRRRPLWPVAVVMVPPALGAAWCIVSGSDAIVPVVYVYLLLCSLLLAIYMLYALRQYRIWLRDNYADLEHKELWQTFAVMASILFVLVYYTFGGNGVVYEFVLQISALVLVCFLLWRVETLSDLSNSLTVPLEAEVATTKSTIRNGLSEPDDSGITHRLQKYCVDTQLYLAHDLTATELAKAIGTNRTYLSQYFSRRGVTYNAYINGLRIENFISLYREAAANNRHVTAQDLARQSGFRSYSTFSLAFKQRMGHSVMAWIRTIG